MPHQPGKPNTNQTNVSSNKQGGSSNIPTIVPISYEQFIGSSKQGGSSSSSAGSTNQRSLSSKPGLNLESAANFNPYSSGLSNRNLINPSPNAVLYQKLLELVSTSADLANQNELSTQMSTLLSNPNIKARLKQLHTQLLKDPNEYWPKLENILLDDSKLQKNNNPNMAANQKDQIKLSQDLIDLKNFYSKEYFNNNNGNNGNNNSMGSSNSPSSSSSASTSSSSASTSPTASTNNNNNNNNNTMMMMMNNPSMTINSSNNSAAVSAAAAYYSKTQPRIINREMKK